MRILLIPFILCLTLRTVPSAGTTEVSEDGFTRDPETFYRMQCGASDIAEAGCKKLGCRFNAKESIKCSYPVQNPFDPRFFQYRGCYEESPASSGTRDFVMAAKKGSISSIEDCIGKAWAYSPSSSIVGVQAKDECFFGPEFSNMANRKVDDSKCSSGCKASSDKCGGVWHNSVYDYTKYFSKYDDATVKETLYTDNSPEGITFSRTASSPTAPFGVCDGMVIYGSRAEASFKPFVIHGWAGDVLRIEQHPEQKDTVLCSTSFSAPDICGTPGNSGFKTVMVHISECDALVFIDGKRTTGHTHVRLYNLHARKIEFEGADTLRLGGLTACRNTPVCPWTVQAEEGSNAEPFIRLPKDNTRFMVSSASIAKWTLPRSGIPNRSYLEFSLQQPDRSNSNFTVPLMKQFKMSISGINFGMSMGTHANAYGTKDQLVIDTNDGLGPKVVSGHFPYGVTSVALYVEDCYAWVYVDGRIQSSDKIPLTDLEGKEVTFQSQNHEGLSHRISYKEGSTSVNKKCNKRKASEINSDLVYERCSMENVQRYPCGGNATNTREKCNAKGCCWIAGLCAFPIQTIGEPNDFSGVACVLDNSNVGTDSLFHLGQHLYKSPNNSSTPAYCREKAFKFAQTASTFSMKEVAGHSHCQAGGVYDTLGDLKWHKNCFANRCSNDSNIPCGTTNTAIVYEYNIPPAIALQDQSLRWKLMPMKMSDKKFVFDHSISDGDIIKSLGTKNMHGLCDGMMVHVQRSPSNNPIIIKGAGGKRIIQIEVKAGTQEIICSDDFLQQTNVPCGSTPVKDSLDKVTIYFFGCHAYITVGEEGMWKRGIDDEGKFDAFAIGESKAESVEGGDVYLGGVSSCLPAPICTKSEFPSAPYRFPSGGGFKLLAHKHAKELEFTAPDVCDGSFLEFSAATYYPEDLLKPDANLATMLSNTKMLNELLLIMGDEQEYRIETHMDMRQVKCTNKNSPEAGPFVCGLIPISGMTRLGLHIKGCQAAIYVNGIKQNHRPLPLFTGFNKIKMSSGGLANGLKVSVMETEGCQKVSKLCNNEAIMAANPRCTALNTVHQSRLFDCGGTANCYQRGCCQMGEKCYYPHQNPFDPKDYSAQGCYIDKDAPSRDIPIQAYVDKSNHTPEKCLEASWMSGINKRVMGSQNGYQCMIGMTYGNMGKGSGCTVNCAGDKNRKCGGGFHNNIYTLNHPPALPQIPDIFPAEFLLYGEDSVKFAEERSLCNGLKIHIKKKKVTNDYVKIHNKKGEVVFWVYGRNDGLQVYCTDNILAVGDSHVRECGMKTTIDGFTELMITFMNCEAFVTVDGTNGWNGSVVPHTIVDSGMAEIESPNGLSISVGGVSACPVAPQCSIQTVMAPALAPITNLKQVAVATKSGDSAVYYLPEQTLMFDGMFVLFDGIPTPLDQAESASYPLDGLEVSFGGKEVLKIKVDAENHAVMCKQDVATNSYGSPAISHDWMKCGLMYNNDGVESLGVLFSQCYIHIYVDGILQHSSLRLLDDFLHTVNMKPLKTPAGAKYSMQSRISIGGSKNGKNPMMCKVKSHHHGVLGCYKMYGEASAVHEVGKDSQEEQCVKKCAGYAFFSIPNKADECHCWPVFSVQKSSNCSEDTGHRVVAITANQQGSGYTYVGCVHRTLSEYDPKTLSNDKMDYEMCAGFCAGFKFFGIFRGKTCRCMNTSGQQGSSPHCMLPCGADNTAYERCGGWQDVTVFRYDSVPLYKSFNAHKTRPDRKCGLKNLVLDGPSTGEVAECSINGLHTMCNDEGRCVAESANASNILEEFTPIYDPQENYNTTLIVRGDGNCGPGVTSDTGAPDSFCDPAGQEPCCRLQKDGKHKCEAPNSADGSCATAGDIDMRQYFVHLARLPLLTTTSTTTTAPAAEACKLWYLDVDLDGAYTIPIDLETEQTLTECQISCSKRPDCAIYVYNMHHSLCTLKSKNCRGSEYEVDGDQVACKSASGGILRDDDAMTVSANFAVVYGPSHCNEVVPDELPGVWE